ncbi:MAG: iron ABC transporter substrate-binding protein [Actinomycetota bacterium]
MTRKRWYSFAMLGLMIALAACGGDDAGGGTQADGKITVYSGRSEALVGTLIAQFEAQTGIDVEVRYGSTSEMAALLAEEGSGSPADVFWAQDAGALGAVQAKNLFRKLPGSVLDGVAEAFRSEQGNWVGVSGRVRVIAYNPDLVPTAQLPASVDALTGAAWKDKVGWAPSNGSFQLFVTAFRKVKGEDAARSWLQAMKANGAKTYPGNDAIVAAVAAGEIPLGLVNHYYAFEVLAETPDAKVKDHFLPGGDLGGLVNVSGAGILTTSKNQAAAQRFIEFLLSPAGQAYFVSETYEYPLAGDVAPDPRLPKLDALDPPSVDLSDLGDLEGTLALLEEVGLL